MVPQVIDSEIGRELIAALGPVSGAGRRGLLRVAEVVAVARSEAVLGLVRPHLPEAPAPVRAIYFDKSPDSNWLVPWHQDLTLAVSRKADVPTFGPWSVKDGIPHVHAPCEFLERMLTVRIHLDDADETNGALRVLPGSHRFGRMSSEAIREFRSGNNEVLCSVEAGGAVLMRPLLLHASSRSTSDRHRRVLHLEYAGFPLPAPLAWHEAI